MATNNLRVLYNPLPENQTKRDFAVCVKGLAYPDVDLSARFAHNIIVVEEKKPLPGWSSGSNC